MTQINDKVTTIYPKQYFIESSQLKRINRHKLEDCCWL